MKNRGSQTKHEILKVKMKKTKCALFQSEGGDIPKKLYIRRNNNKVNSIETRSTVISPW